MCVQVQYGGLVSQLAARAGAAVRELDKRNELTCLRVQSTRCELTIAPDQQFILIVLQNRPQQEQESSDKTTGQTQNTKTL